MTDIIQGALLLVVFVALGLLALIVQHYKAASNVVICDGVVTASDKEGETITVSYTAGGQPYCAPYNCKSYAAADEKPPADLNTNS